MLFVKNRLFTVGNIMNYEANDASFELVNANPLGNLGLGTLYVC